MTPPGVHPLGRSLTQTRPPPLPLLLLQLLPPLPPPPTRMEVAVVAAEAGAAEYSGTSTPETRGDRRRRRHCPQLGPGPTCWRAAKAAARSPWSPLPLLPPPPPLPLRPPAPPPPFLPPPPTLVPLPGDVTPHGCRLLAPWTGWTGR